MEVVHRFIKPACSIPHPSKGVWLDIYTTGPDVVTERRCNHMQRLSHLNMCHEIMHTVECSTTCGKHVSVGRIKELNICITTHENILHYLLITQMERRLT